MMTTMMTTMMTKRTVCTSSFRAEKSCKKSLSVHC
jgi:hypothetical protein